MTQEQSDALTTEQYKKVMKEIWKNHRWVRSKFEHSKHIKYVRPNWDMRDGHASLFNSTQGRKYSAQATAKRNPCMTAL